MDAKIEDGEFEHEVAADAPTLSTEGALALSPSEESVTREQRRSRRKRDVRARTISVKRMTKRATSMSCMTIYVSWDIRRSRWTDRPGC